MAPVRLSGGASFAPPFSMTIFARPLLAGAASVAVNLSKSTPVPFVPPVVPPNPMTDASTASPVPSLKLAVADWSRIASDPVPESVTATPVSASAPPPPT